MDVQGSVAFVTGGAGGLGLAAATALAARGARVVVADLPRALEAAPLPPTWTPVEMDVTDSAQVERAVQAAAELGPLRVTVNCAGTGIPAKVVPKEGLASMESFRREITVNLIGTLDVIRVAAATMARLDPQGEERGIIVNTASIAAFEGQIGQAGYSASKGGIVGLTLPVARELAAHLIRVVTIAPGLFDTPLLASLPDAARASLGASVPHPARLGNPAEYAALVTHVVENPMLNGETIRLDGALRMAPR